MLAIQAIQNQFTNIAIKRKRGGLFIADLFLYDKTMLGVVYVKEKKEWNGFVTLNF